VYNALYTACKTGGVPAVKQILDDLKLQSTASETVDVAEAGEVADDGGEVPVGGGKVPAAVSRLLCHRGRNNSTTLLHVASGWSHVAVVRLLLQHGADPAVKYAALFTSLPVIF